MFIFRLPVLKTVVLRTRRSFIVCWQTSSFAQRPFLMKVVQNRDAMDDAEIICPGRDNSRHP